MREGAFGVVFNEARSKVLLVKRRDIPIWVLPGGGIDDGESPLAAAIREVKEETGLDCSLVKHVALYTAKNSLAANTYLYELKGISSELALSDETVGVGFFDIDSLPDPFFSLHIGWIQDCLSNKDEAIVKPVEGITLRNIVSFAARHPQLFFRYIASRLGFPINR